MACQAGSAAVHAMRFWQAMSDTYRSVRYVRGPRAGIRRSRRSAQVLDLFLFVFPILSCKLFVRSHRRVCRGRLPAGRYADVCRTLLCVSGCSLRRFVVSELLGDVIGIVLYASFLSGISRAAVRSPGRGAKLRWLRNHGPGIRPRVI